VKDKLISAFGSELCQSLRALLSGQQDNVTTVTQILPGLLKDYSIKLSHGEKEGPKKDAAVFVYQYRQYVASTASMSNMHIYPFLSRLPLKSIIYLTISRNIAGRFEESMLSVPRETDDISRQARNMSSLTTEEKLSCWNTEGSDAPDLPVEKPAEFMLNTKEDEGPNSPLFTETRTILIQSKAYQWLVGRIQTILTTTEGTTVEFISQMIRWRLNSDQADEVHTATFRILWSPRRFLREQNYQKGERQAIGEVITLTGSAIDAQAMTCAQYMNQTWPLSGTETLGALQAAMAEIPNHWHKCIWLISQICIPSSTN